MEKRCRILLYGNSVILGSIEVSLRTFPQYEVLSHSLEVLGVPALEALRPDVILFDSEATRPQAIFSLLETCPGLMLIGVSPDTNLVKVWSWRHLRELSTQDLLKVIDEQTKNSPIFLNQMITNKTNE